MLSQEKQDKLPRIYHFGIILNVIGQLSYAQFQDFFQPISTDGSVILIVDLSILTAIITLPIFIYLDGKSKFRRDGWPNYLLVFYVIPSAIPALGLFIGIGYLFNKFSYSRRGRPFIGIHLLSALRDDPKGAMTNLYQGFGVVLSVYFFLVIILAVPLRFLLGEDNLLSTTIGIGIAIFTLIFLTYRSLVKTGDRKDLDILVRDVLVRSMSIVGLAVSVMSIVFLLMVPVGVSLSPIVFVDESLYRALLYGFLLALFILPLSVAFLLPIRLLPWINALPLIGRDLLSKLKAASNYGVPNGDHGDVKMAPDSILPRSGYEYTDVSIDSHMEFEGYYGYRPTPIDELQLDTLPTSRRWATRLFIFPYLFAVAVFTYVQIRPERAAELASVLPAENALVAGGSFIGVPRVVITQIISYLGLPPEMISLGFIGLVVPGILMIPAAWHVALEYESLQYRILQRLGGNHHLLIWLLQFAMPVVVLYLWYEDWSGPSWNILPRLGDG